MRKILLTTLTLFFCSYMHAEENDAIYVWIDGESTCYKLESMPKVTFGNGTAILTLSGKTTPELTIPITDDNNLLEISTHILWYHLLRYVPRSPNIYLQEESGTS
jgi:hypothetical protein